MDNKFKRIGAVALAAAVFAGSVSAGSLGRVNAAEEEKTETQESIDNEYPELLASHSKDGGLYKEETAYVITDADGNIQDVTVTEWLKNGTGADSIRDTSSLTDIENTANDKGYTENGNDLIWDAQGSDIRYKGKATRDLPVDVKVSYYLDGEKMSAKEIAGKAGNIEIRFDYTVKDKTYADGYEFSTPYAMASGVVLDDSHFTDISIESGKVVDDGSRAICLGLAFPGMGDNLNMDTGDFDIPENVSIKAYTDKFEMGGTYTIVLSGLLSGLDMSDADSAASKIDQLTDALSELSNAADKLVDGSEDLADGTKKLESNAATLNDGAQSLSDASDMLSKGADALVAGAAQLLGGTADAVSGTARLSEGTGALRDGTAGLSEGLNELSGGSTDLKNGVNQYVGAADQIIAGINTVKDGADQVLAGEAAFHEALGQLSESGKGLRTSSAQMREILTTIRPLVEASDRYKSYVPYIDAALTYLEGVDAYTKGVDQLYASDEQILEGLEALVGTEADEDKPATGLTALAEGGAQLSGQSDALTEGAAGLEAGVQQSAAGAGELAAGAASADDGAKALAQGAAAINNGAGQVKSAADQIADGTGQLSNGASSLADGTDKFADGTSTLADGASELAAGVSKFNKEGVKKLVSTLSDADIDGILDRIDALADASGQYSLIGGISAGMDGESRIIIKSGEVKAQ